MSSCRLQNPGVGHLDSQRLDRWITAQLCIDDSFYVKVMVPSIMHLEALIDQLTPYGETTTTLVLSSAVKRRTIEHGPEEPLDEPVQIG